MLMFYWKIIKTKRSFIFIFMWFEIILWSLNLCKSWSRALSCCLGTKIPIHIFFTMPWTPTSEFPHPLSRVKQHIGYRLSYQIVDALIWLGI
ncbi:putative sterol 3-beta-glucosyltransferase [Rosa chinensis]|uniref:Putative sterol 3-beta-glucosyltransferase n=1 Tax=Rosa chinensis TaxID=74649 RepID=A0A2P6SF20_ROSCH|nr:putative sterol 3-beta-glucosyltransferase [Rosa chinensis]